MEKSTSSLATNWVLDAMHSEVHFKVKHLVISTVTGTLKVFEGNFETVNDDFSNANISFTADINSIDTNQEQRDVHLKSADFFDAETYPKMIFKSTSFKKMDDGEYELIGDLTIRDVTKSVKLDVEYGGLATDFYGNTKAGFELKGKINRKDFGLVWNGITEAGAIVVGEDIKLDINVQFAKSV